MEGKVNDLLITLVELISNAISVIMRYENFKESIFIPCINMPG